MGLPSGMKKSFSITSLFNQPEMGTIIPLVLMAIIIGAVNGKFFAPNNLIDIFRATSYSFMIAAPLTCLLISGGSDLTIGAVTSLGGVVCAWSMSKLGLPIFLSILLALAAGAAVGFIKSLIVVCADLPPFIVTLGLQYIINGFVLVWTSGIPITGLNDNFKGLGQGRAAGLVYWTIIIAVSIGVVIQLVLSKTKIGREFFAVGGNQETARLAGISIEKTRFASNILVSVFAAFCGVCMASRFNSAQTTAGAGTELTILASVIIGGTSMMGGSGSVIGSFLGCLLLAVINNGLILMAVSSYWQNLIFGTLLVASLFIDKYRRSKSGE